MLILKIIFGSLFIFAGVSHLIKPTFFKHFIPSGIPKLTVNYVVGLIELFLGLGLFFSSTFSYAILGVVVLLILFLPIHLWDATKKRPAIGSKFLAYLRIPLQILLLYGAYIIYQYSLTL